MKILQKDGKCTIESEGAAKVGQSYTFKQFVDDLIAKTKSGKIVWEKDSTSSSLYHATVGGRAISIRDDDGYELWLGFFKSDRYYKDGYKHHLKMGFWSGRKLWGLVKGTVSGKMNAEKQNELQQEMAEIRNSLS